MRRFVSLSSIVCNLFAVAFITQVVVGTFRAMKSGACDPLIADTTAMCQPRYGSAKSIFNYIRILAFKVEERNVLVRLGVFDLVLIVLL
jgi:hypothetical protein